MKKVVTYLIIIILIDYIIATVNSPKVSYVEKAFLRYNANTLPPFGIVIAEKHKENIAIHKHELKHWEQYQRTGAIPFVLKYAYQYLVYGYDLMPMEIEARKAAGESEFCLTNYTICVRNCIAETVCNSDFRL